MSEKATPADSKRKRSGGINVVKLVAAGLVVAAVIKELRLPRDQRTWHGSIAGFVPYDFRVPTLEKIKATFWNPAGSVIVGRPFGVGWTINLGALVTKVRALVNTG